MNRTIYNPRLVLCILAVMAIFFSFYRLTESPPVWYDEGWYMQTSANLVTTGIDGIQLAPAYIYHVPFLTVGYPLIYPLALVFKIFGMSVLSARTLMALFILGFLAVSYFLSKRIFGMACGLGALLLLVTFPPLYGNGKSVLGEVPGIFYLAVFLVCFNKSLSSPRKWFWLIAGGVAAGLCAATKPFFLILLPVLLVGAWLEWKRKTLTLKDISLGVFCTCVPILIWLFVQFHAGSGSASSILSFYANPYAEKSITGIILTNTKLLFTDPSTLYTMGLIFIWSLSVWFRTRKKEQFSSVEVMSFVFSWLTILAFLRTGGLFRYLFPAQALILLFFPYACLSACGGVFKKLSSERIQQLTIAAVLAVSLLGLYQLMFSSWVAESYNSHKTAFWEQYFAKLPVSTSVFFYDAPEVVPLIQGTNYYQFLLSPAGSSTGGEELSVLRAGRADEVIIDSNKYDATQAIFKLYAPEETDYKYTILKRI